VVAEGGRESHRGAGGYIRRDSWITMSKYCSSWVASYMEASC